jgi:hypothetical protein
MFWFVYFIFFIIAPMQSLHGNYLTNDGPVSYFYFEQGEIFKAFSITWIFPFVLTIFSLLQRYTSSGGEKNIQYEYYLKGEYFFVVFCVAIGGFLIFVLLSGGLSNVLAPRADKIRDEISPFATAALALQIVSTFLMVSMFASSRKFMTSLIVIFAMAGALLMLSIAQNPYNAARYFLIQSWLPIVLILIKGRLPALAFYWLCFVGLLVILPIVSLTGRFGAGVLEAVDNVDITKDFFQIPYVDVFDVLLYSVHYLEGLGYDYGIRTLGAMFFFVPRSIWEGKPFLLAQQIGEELVGLRLAGTDNLSFFFAGEFYADFGIVGVFVLSLITVYLCKKFFENYNFAFNGVFILEFIAISALPVVVRGPIGANASLVFMEIFFFVVCSKFFTRRRFGASHGFINRGGAR